MRKPVAENVRPLTVEREQFEEAIRKLLATPPTSKKAITRKINLMGRRRRLTAPLLPR
jgi:hypothetical protein